MSESSDNHVNVRDFACERTHTFYDLDKKVIVDHLVQVWKEPTINLNILTRLFKFCLKKRNDTLQQLSPSRPQSNKFPNDFNPIEYFRKTIGKYLSI